MNCEQSPPSCCSKAASLNDPAPGRPGRLFSSNHTKLRWLRGWEGWWDRAGDALRWQ